MTAAFLLAIIKAVPAAEQILRQLMELYANWKKEQNLTDEKDKNARDAALIDGAAGRLPKLCAECPFAGLGGGQHGAAVAAPSVPAGGSGGS